ncbi:MAG: response regulator transcription factor [Thermoanaerobaculia bacterium]|nr:response regulator transcription factor [Thermoanaerobaculia bacterium]
MTSSTRPEPARVWIVEDGRLLRESLRRLIDGEADLVCSLAAESCEALFDALDAGDTPDLVLMDLSLPGASGIEGTARLQQLLPECPVVVLTVHDDDRHVYDAIRAGATGYLLKPSSPEEVVAAVREAQRGAAPINSRIGRRILSFFSRLPDDLVEHDDDYGLSPREREVLQLVVDGLGKPAIARRLGLSYHTVGNHVRSIYRKLQVRSRAQAVAKAIREDIV